MGLLDRLLQEREERAGEPFDADVPGSTTWQEKSDPRSYECPACGAAPGKPCVVHPSGHVIVGGGFHVGRSKRAEDRVYG